MLRKTALALVLACLWCDSARAEPLRIERSAEKMRVDGALREWRGARFATLGEGEDASLRYALAATDDGLYLGAEVRDERLVTGEQGDALVLTLAFPAVGGRMRDHQLTLLPGETGRSPSRALVAAGAAKRPRTEARVQVVEGPRPSGAGYVLEAFVPWALLGETSLWEQGRGSLRLRDVDGKGSATELASASATEPGLLPRLALGEGHQDLLGSLLAAKQLSGVEPSYDFRANVAADAREERVVIVDRYVVVYGPGFGAGERSAVFALPLGLGGGLERAEVLDLTGDGRGELTLRLRQRNELGARTLFMVLGVDDARITPVFAVEIKKEVAGGFVENTLALVRRGKEVPRIDVKLGRSQGLDAARYREAPATDAQPILLPWGDVEARSYAFDGKRFAVLSEQKRARPAVAEGVATKAPERPSVSVEPLAATSAGDPRDAYREARGLASSARARRTLRANLVGGRAPELIEVYGSELVVTGPDVGHGRGYLTYGLPVRSADDLRELRAVSIDGGPADELLLRVRQPLGGAEGVERDLLLVLRGDDAGRLARALLAEVARRQGERAIENRVTVRDGALVREPGTAKGWTGASYPFTADAIGGAERLLLPWSDAPLRYRSEGNALVAGR